jgi:hypothetical protein
LKRWQRTARRGAVAVISGGIGYAMAAMGMVPGVTFAGAARQAVPCDRLPGRAVPSLGADHLSYLGEPHKPYNSRPPTSGPHMPWIISGGVYRQPVADEYQVHLLEHGKVLIQYPVGSPAATGRRLEGFARRHPDKVVVAPSGHVPAGIALTAWTRLDRLPGYDERRIRRFIDALGGRYDHGWSAGAGECAPR